jgi:hypothetical protein
MHLYKLFKWKIATDEKTCKSFSDAYNLFSLGLQLV